MRKNIYIFTDAHISGLGAILAQGDSYQDAKPVVIASRTTSNAEARYPQLDLEAAAIDFALRRFRNYIVGAPSIEIITDHKPLCPIFNKYRQGSIRTDRIKLRHQDINYQVIYQKGKLNQSDYLSCHGKPFKLIPETEQKETEDLHNLLYTLHTTPIIDNIGISSIAKETIEDPILKELMKIIRKGQNWIPNSSANELKRFKHILDEITITGNDILMKSDRIILPSKLQTAAIALAHKGSHPGISQLERRLRYHFFFHDMQQKVKQYVESCIDCSSFIDKKTSEPLRFHRVPTKNWEVVAVDLYGPMPSKNHVVVVQDLGSRFPAAKLVSSTKSAKVLPALEEIYNAYGNPEIQISDNGPPFNSKAMDNFANKKNIEMKKIPPLHPSSNPVETLMRPLGKTMKIAHQHNQSEKKTLEDFLQNYRDTPHPATGVPPAAMMFRDDKQTHFPRKSISDEECIKARSKDKDLKQQRTEQINCSKYRKEDCIKNGDKVLIRNYKKQKKFDPIFIPEPYKVLNTDEHTIIVENCQSGTILKRHRDDIKLLPKVTPNKIITDSDENSFLTDKYRHCHCTCDCENFARQINNEYNDSYTSSFFQDKDVTYQNEETHNMDQISSTLENLQIGDDNVPPRRSTRERKPNRRYFNNETITNFDK